MSYILAIGPSAPSWPGPQRLVLTVEGEQVTDVTYRERDDVPDFTDRLPHFDLERVLYEVTGISKTSSYAHALAFCQAIEALTSTTVPERAAFLRCAMAEIERTSAHLAALGHLFELIGQQHQAAELRELGMQMQEIILLLNGNNTRIDMCLPGGVRSNLNDLQQSQLIAMIDTINHDLFQLIDQTIDENRLLARTIDVGPLSKHVAEQFGLTGPLARASGLECDTRIDQPYAAYDRLDMRRIMQEGGDVHARLVVLMLEAFESLKLAEYALQNLPDGPWEGALPAELPFGEASAAVEAPRGTLRYHIQSDGFRLSALTIEPPRQIDRLLARTLFVGALVDNVLLIALSADPPIEYRESQART